MYEGWYCEYENAVGETPINAVISGGRMLYPTDFAFEDGEWMIVRRN
jgi:hypothetical protein